MDGNLGSLDGAVLRDVHEHFVDAELEADWAEALMAIVRAAATNQANQPGGSVIVTNVVVDIATFERHLRQVCNDEPEGDEWVEPVAERDPRAPRSPKDGTGFRCDTLDGVPIDPAAATASALVHHVRRVVVGADGVVVDVGRKARLFTGARRLAVLIGETTCYWPGCNVAVTDCEADHLDGFNSRKRGPTNPGNGGPACGFHNRLKEHGFTAHRDEQGHWHVDRPDGTEIT
jgi:hypothetical protein